MTVVIASAARMRELGLVHIYTGDGKGKTTSSLGLALRALGHGLKVYMIQFLKGGAYVGELKIMEKLPDFVIKQYGKGSKDMPHFEDFDPDENDNKRAELGFKEASKVLDSKKWDLLILDEINTALDKGHLSFEKIKKLIEKRGKTELVLTGRGAPKGLIEIADYVTDMKAVRHPYDKGVLGRPGIDY
jgi:cob(I)alamin adenosyltransferase